MKPRSLLAVITLVFLCQGSMAQAADADCQIHCVERKWYQSLWFRYNFGALRKFLITQVKTHPEVDGASLSGLTVGRKWQKVAGGSRACGAWLFWDNRDDPKQFYISCTYATEHPPDAPRVYKNITFRCERISRSKFKMIEVKRYDQPEK